MSQSTIERVDPQRTLTLAVAALEAYQTYAKHPHVVPPPGYQTVGTWSGVDQALGIYDQDEPYGVIFAKESDPGDVIFAFRGTDSFMDAVEDLKVDTQTFVPYANASGANAVAVMEGFYQVYADQDEGRGVRSQQRQLFDWLDKLKPTCLSITGHSLGSALATLFTLDLLISRTDQLPKTIHHTNLACPRVGQKGFLALYGSLAQEHLADGRAVRIVNHFDFVPKLPPRDLDYRHVGDAFQVAFRKQGALLPHPEVRHSIVDYHAVLEQALKRPDQVYVGSLKGVDGTELESLDPRSL